MKAAPKADLVVATATTATETLLSLAMYRNASSIGIYLSMPKGELSTEAIVHDAFKQGKRVFAPYIYKVYSRDSAHARSAMDMVALQSLHDYENLEPDSWGIPSIPEASINERERVLGEGLGSVGGSTKEKPMDDESSYKTGMKGDERLDVIVMPGLAFDRGLGRLGHGKGFYDHFLERYHASKPSPLPLLGT